MSYFSTLTTDNRPHFFGHFGNTEKSITFPCSHAVETRPHIFQAPSTIFTVINIYAYSFSHDHDLFVQLRVGLFQPEYTGIFQGYL